jgi:hypothetical protein
MEGAMKKLMLSDRVKKLEAEVAAIATSMQNFNILTDRMAKIILDMSERISKLEAEKNGPRLFNAQGERI